MEPKDPLIDDSEIHPDFAQNGAASSDMESLIDDSEVHPDFQDNIASDNSSELENLKAKAIAAATGVVTEGVKSKAVDWGQNALNRYGNLTETQQNMITANPERYKKIESLQKTAQEFADLTNRTRQNAFGFNADAVESLKGLGDVEGNKVIESMSNINTAPLFNIPKSDLPQPKIKTEASSQLQSISKNKQALENKLNAMLESGIESAGMDAQINAVKSQLADVNSQYASLNSQTQIDMRNPEMPTLRDYSEVTNFPEDILAANPNLKTKQINKKYGSLLKDQVDQLKNRTLPAYDFGKKYIQELQDMARYNALNPSDETNKFKQEMARNASQELRSLEGTEDFAKYQDLSSEAIKIEEGLADFGLELNENVTGRPSYNVRSDSKLKSMYNKGNEGQVKRLEDLLQRAEELNVLKNTPLVSSLDGISSPLALDLPLANIKTIASTAKDTTLARAMKGVLGAGVSSTLGMGPVAGAVTANAVLDTGSKAQEAIALAKGGKAWKGLAKTSKVLGPLAGIAAGALSYEDAKQRGLASSEAGATAIGEVINPIPFTDVTGAYIAGKNVYTNAFEGKDDPWYQDIATAAINTPEATSEAASAYSKPLVSQMEDTAKGRAANIAQNLNPRKEVQEKSRAENIAQNYKMGKIENSPDKIANLEDLYNKFKSMAGSKGAESTAQTIDKAINGNEDEKVKADFLIQQNPMLRNKLK